MSPPQCSQSEGCICSADQELSRCLQAAACHLRTLLAASPGADSSRKALLSAVLQSLHALQKALLPRQTSLPSTVLIAAAEGVHMPVPT